MTKFFTDIKQSQKLIELGIDVNTVDMYYPNRIGMDNYPLPIEWKNGNPLLSQEIPAWSLSALMHLMPTHYVVEKCSDSYCCYNFSVKEFFASTAVDAAFEMVCWLKENKKI